MLFNCLTTTWQYHAKHNVAPGMRLHPQRTTVWSPKFLKHISARERGNQLVERDHIPYLYAGCSDKDMNLNKSSTTGIRVYNLGTSYLIPSNIKQFFIQSLDSTYKIIRELHQNCKLYTLKNTDLGRYNQLKWEVGREQDVHHFGDLLHQPFSQSQYDL